VRTVLVGSIQTSSRPGHWTGIDKKPVDHEVFVSVSGLAGDAQGDTVIHGGVDKAVHAYPWSHYPHWRGVLQHNLRATQLLSAPGAFGENLSVEGLADEVLDERAICLGDQWRIGAATVLEVSQGRQPCWKLNDRFEQRDMAAQLQHSLRAGWYLRVLKSGVVKAGDPIVLLRRPHPDWSIARLLELIDRRATETSTLREVLALPLPDSWRRLFARRLASGEAEAWERRLDGPDTHESRPTDDAGPR